MLLIKGAVPEILIKDGRIVEIADSIAETGDMIVLDATGFVIAPGLVDIHVHFREPGFEYKEDIITGAMAAAAGGVTTCCCMANTMPVADSPEVIKYIIDKAAKAAVKVLPIGAVTYGLKGTELTDFAALKKAGAVALSDDGMPIVSDEMMRQALIAAEKENLIIISHCEEEAPMVERDVRLAAETGAKIHIAHVSTADAVETIRKAKAAGVKVTAETCPHYFSLTKATVEVKGTNAKMSPSLRTERDVEAIIEGLCDGTIDAIVTDHAPHSEEEKALPLDKAPNGIIGLETMLATTLTYLYDTGKLSLERLVELMTKESADILGLDAGVLKVGGVADIVIFDPNKEWVVDSTQFKSKARNTPYGGMKLKGKVKYTISYGEVVYKA